MGNGLGQEHRQERGHGLEHELQPVLEHEHELCLDLEPVGEGGTWADSNVWTEHTLAVVLVRRGKI